MTAGWRDRTGEVCPSSVPELVFASEAEVKNRSILNRFFGGQREVFFY